MLTGPYFKVLDLDTPPPIPKGWSFHLGDQPKDRLRGRLCVNNSYLVPFQMYKRSDPPGSIERNQTVGQILESGKKILVHYDDMRLFQRVPGHVLSYLSRSDLECESFKVEGMRYHFLGTVYRDNHNRKVVRSLVWSKGKFLWERRKLDACWEDRDWEVYVTVVSKLADELLRAFGHI